MEDSERPKFNLAKKVLPNGLVRALEEIFKLIPAGVFLVGGTALAGFYASHRRSDDLDLFCENQESFDLTVNAIKHLSTKGAVLEKEFRTPNYYRTLVTFGGHTFTCDAVLDPNIFKIGQWFDSGSGIRVASLLSLLKMKSATLVSRGSEKDLFDLIWLFDRFPQMTIKDFISFGVEVDAGVSGENMIYALGSTEIKSEACGFCEDLGKTKEDVFKNIEIFRSNLIKSLSLYLHQKKPTGVLAEIIQDLKKLRGK